MSSVFSKILNGELPGRFIYRDETAAAFLTIEPVAYGHTLVVPVAEVDRWTDLEPQVWTHLTQVAQWVGKAVVKAFDCSRAGMMIAGFDVPHTHIHVFPAEDMSGYNLSTAMGMNNTDPALMDEAAARLRSALEELGVPAAQ